MAKSNPLSALDAKMAPEVLEAAKAKTEEMLFDLQLAELRKIAKLSQVELATAMGITQPTVANLEKEGQNLRLTSLKRYVEAAGCKLKIDIELPDGTSHGVCL
ncbi:Transcriptional regulator [Vibrio coralliirubri]|uniref:helix-turn-helix domain-containing protein n=1 Tax=Vibrio coralliirubri TaxID=1516159 RepID=UPI00063A1D2E|nr:XRE family transcriptional regulator [Vibrio coralliirubri]CDT53033.1 Transcriptional regulator [Vibrio coralliirubri]